MGYADRTPEQRRASDLRDDARYAYERFDPTFYGALRKSLRAYHEGRGLSPAEANVKALAEITDRSLRFVRLFRRPDQRPAAWQPSPPGSPRGTG